MKVMVLTSEYPRAGAPNRANFNRQHLNALAELHEVFVVCPVTWLDYLQSSDRYSDFGRPANASDRIRVDYLPYLYPPGLFRGAYDRWMWYSMRSRLRSMAADFRPDIILGVWAFPDGAVALRLARQLEIPVVVQVLGSDVNLLDQFPEKRSGTLNTLRAAEHVITVSQALRAAVCAEAVPQDRVSVVYRGVNAQMFEPRDRARARSELGLDSGARHLLFVGNLVPVKNPGLLLEAFCGLDAREPTELHFLGNGSLKEALRKRASAMSLPGPVHFHGAVDHRKIPDWMAAADLLVLSSNAEGVPNVLLEARSLGCPYVATRVGGIPEISMHAGARLVDPGNVEAMREALWAALQGEGSHEPQPWQSWSEAGRNMAAVLERVADECTVADRH